MNSFHYKKLVALCAISAACTPLLGGDSSSRRTGKSVVRFSGLSAPEQRADLEDDYSNRDARENYPGKILRVDNFLEQTISGQSADILITSIAEKDRIIDKHNKEICELQKKIERRNWIITGSTLIITGFITEKVAKAYPQLFPTIGKWLYTLAFERKSDPGA